MNPVDALAWLGVAVLLIVLSKLLRVSRYLRSLQTQWRLYLQLRDKFGVEGLLTLAQAGPAGAIQAAPQTQNIQVSSAPQGAKPAPVLPPVDPTVVPGTKTALLNPPSNFMVTLYQLERNTRGTEYTFPLGWYLSPVTNQPALATGGFIRDVNIVQIVGKQNSGKDNFVRNIFFSLARRHGPEQVQFAILDGKGVDWDDWETKAHTWGLASESEDIPTLMAALTAERRRRKALIKETVTKSGLRCKKWEAYEERRKAGDHSGPALPLLVVYIAELNGLEEAIKTQKASVAGLDAATKAEKLGGIISVDQWLSDEFTKGRAFGIRYVIGSQTMVGRETVWRSQVDLVVAGALVGPQQDQANTGVSTATIKEWGGTPPSQLPAPQGGVMGGIFTLIADGSAITVRSAYLSDETCDRLLARLSDRVIIPEIDELPASTDDQRYAGVEQLLANSNIPGLTSTQAAPALSQTTAAEEAEDAPEPLKPEIEQAIPQLLRIGVEQFGGRWPLKKVQPIAKGMGINIGYNAMVDDVKPVLEARGLIAMVEGQWVVTPKGKALTEPETKSLKQAA